MVLPDITSAADVIDNHLGLVFDSHDFIMAYLKSHEREYIEGLYSAIDAGGGIFRAYHAQIGRFLEKYQNELGIRPVERVSTENIKDYESDNMKWRKAV